MSSEAQITANRANAQLSTGPITEAGKAKSSHNAVKTGLTGRTILLPTDDREVYLQHVARFFTKYQPVTEDEKALTQSVADTEWRLVRIPSLESGIYCQRTQPACGRICRGIRPRRPRRQDRSASLSRLPPRSQ